MHLCVCTHFCLSAPSPRREKQVQEQAKHADTPYVPKHDLSLKAGQTFRLNIQVSHRPLKESPVVPLVCCAVHLGITVNALACRRRRTKGTTRTGQVLLRPVNLRLPHPHCKVRVSLSRPVVFSMAGTHSRR